MRKISLEPNAVILRRGPLRFYERLVLGYMEWVWATDTHELIFGDGRRPGGWRHMYEGGTLMVRLQLDCGGHQIVIPPRCTTRDRERMQLPDGFVVFDPRMGRVFVGDGQRWGGIPAQ